MFIDKPKKMGIFWGSFQIKFYFRLVKLTQELLKCSVFGGVKINFKNTQTYIQK